MTPQHVHDCDTCVLLGQQDGADLYFCPTEPTVIARFSDEGSDYVSGLVFVGRIPLLARAAELARERDLLERPEIGGPDVC